MTITITDHSVQNGDTVNIVYRLTEPDKFNWIICLDRDGREYARHRVDPESETGIIAFKVAHGRTVRIGLHAWSIMDSTRRAESDWTAAITIPYPIDVDAVRAIVRSELEAARNERRADQPTVITMPTNADEAESMEKLGFAWLKANAPERLTDAGRDRLTVDELVQVIKAQLIRQAAQDQPSPYVDIVGRDDDTAVLDGEFDLRALANAIVNARTETT